MDAIVTDPPYGLEFMGKEWDHGIPGIPFWTEALRVAKPGCHLLAFGGTRTFHRLACAIEDAGWEIRDTLMWVYGSGFPKSHNLKDEWEGWGTALKPAWEPIILARKPLDGTVAANVQKWGCGSINIDGCRVGIDDTERSVIDNRSGGQVADNTGKWQGPGVARQIGERFKSNSSGRWPANLIHDGSEEVLELFPQSKDGVAVKHRGVSSNGITGWGKCPPGTPDIGYGGSGSASRFFMCCPPDETMVDKTGFSMYNIDISNEGEVSICGRILENQRVGFITIGAIQEVGKFTNAVEQLFCGKNTTENFQRDIVSIIETAIKLMTELKTLNVSPSKSITTFIQECEKTIGLLAALKKENVKDAKNISRLITFKNEAQALIRDIVKSVNAKSCGNGEIKTESIGTPIIEHTASRIKYCAKASRAEREAGCEGMDAKVQPATYGDIGPMDGNPRKVDTGHIQRIRNAHPCVKPLALMRYLCGLVTPPNGIILDPFMGSGTTGMAAKIEGFGFIGIEKEQEYIEIAERRIEATEWRAR